MPPYKAQELHDRNKLGNPSQPNPKSPSPSPSDRTTTPSLVGLGRRTRLERHGTRRWRGGGWRGRPRRRSSGGARPAPCQPPAPPPPSLPVSFFSRAFSRRRCSAALTPLMVIVSALGRSLLQNTWLRYSSPAFRARAAEFGGSASARMALAVRPPLTGNSRIDQVLCSSLHCGSPRSSNYY
jgi:hypothetical protein